METRHLNGVPNDNRLSNLAYGTPTENALDKVGHGTDNRGERHALVRLNRVQVQEVRARLKRGERVGDIAKDYGVTRSCISMIQIGKTWRWLDAVAK
jgi:hypothetical protein